MGTNPRILALVLVLSHPGRDHAALLARLIPRNFGILVAEGITYIHLVAHTPCTSQHLSLALFASHQHRLVHPHRDSSSYCFGSFVKPAGRQSIDSFGCCRDGYGAGPR